MTPSNPRRTAQTLSRWLLVVAASGAPRLARAEGPSTEMLQSQYSAYERATIHEVLKTFDTTWDSNAEGETIGEIYVVPLEVFEDRDPLLKFANMFHIRTRPYVIRREVLVSPGGKYSQKLVDETAINLRLLPQFSLVLCIPAKSKTRGKVDLIVVAKDVWSLRPSWNAAFGSGGLESLTLQPTETNFLGTHQAITARYQWQPNSHLFGARYVMPRVANSRILAVAESAMTVNRRTGKPEGSLGAFSLNQPLFSSTTKWAWKTSISWQNIVYRRYVGAHLAAFESKAADASVPYEYRSIQTTPTISATRSFGSSFKHDLTWGYIYDRRVYRTIDTGNLNYLALAQFAHTALPTTDTRSAPYVQVRSYRSEFAHLLDFETLGLQEDYRLGHDVFVMLTPVSRALGSTRDFLSVYAGAQYTMALADGFTRVGIESQTDLQSDRIPTAYFSANARLVTPRFRLGRLIVDAELMYRYRNYYNQNSSLGGDGRLRGYPSNYLIGPDLIAYNFEYRTQPIEIFTMQIGGALFYDVGDAFNGFDNLRVRQSVGFGARVLFPQFDRVVLRGDFGFPVGSATHLPPAFYFSFGQAFPVSTIAPTL